MVELEQLQSLTGAQEILWKDLGSTREALQNNPNSQYLRRQLVRDFATYVEAHTFYLKKVVLVVQQMLFQLIQLDSPLKARLNEFFSMEFKSSEIQLLREQNAEVDENGGVRSTTKYIQTTRNIRFAQAAYLRATKASFPVEYRSHGWAALREVIVLRNRLTHPKSKEDLIVTDEALENLIAANDWFRATSLGMTQAGNDKLEEFLSLLHTEIRKSAEDTTPNTRHAD